MNKIFEQLLEVRGVGEEFLHPKYTKCGEGGELAGIGEAIERIKLAIVRKETILVYGDYDADGITASVVMHDALRLAGVKNVEVMLPDRFIDGYGMSERAVERAKKIGAGLVVTVDCGSNNGEVIEVLKKEGVDTIVTDHHEILGELPGAVAVINPKRKDVSCPKGMEDLAGVGVAFMLAKGMVDVGMIKSGQEKWMLDLVLIGTICDSMRMRGENRRLCFFGLKVLEKTRRIGLKELMRAIGVKKINSEVIGFQIGPRINATGRMGSASLALRLLMADSKTVAVELMGEIEELNKKRKEEQTLAMKEINERGIGSESVIVVSGKWHEGVLGIVAGRLVEDYKKPAFVLARQEGGVLKGSGRSFGEFSLAKVCLECRECLLGGGGHAGACGVRLEAEKEDMFREMVNKYYRKLGLYDQERFLMEREDLRLGGFGGISLELMEEIGMLEPYGEGNKEPIFLVSGVEVVEARKMGKEENHLGVMLRDRKGVVMKGVGFYAPKEWMTVRVGEIVDVKLKMIENEWNGLRSVEGRIVDLVVLL